MKTESENSDFTLKKSTLKMSHFNQVSRIGEFNISKLEFSNSDFLKKSGFI